MENLNKLFQLTKNNRKLYALSMFFMVLSQFFYVCMPAVIWFSIDSIIGDKPISIPLISTLVNMIGGREYLRNNMLIPGLVFIIVSGLSSLFTYLKSYYTNKSTENIICNLRNRLFRHLQLLPYSYYKEQKAGDILQRSTSDVETIRKLFSIQLVEVFGSFAVIILILIVMFTINIVMATVCAILCLLISILAIWFFKNITKYYQLTDESEALLTNKIQENLMAVRVVRAFNLEGKERESFLTSNRNFQDNQVKLAKVYSRFWAINDLLTLSQIAFVIVYGGILTIQGVLTVGNLSAFVIYVVQIIWPVRQIGKLLTDTGKAFVSVDRINEILDVNEEDINYGDEYFINGDIEFKGVSFKYPNDDFYSLKNLSFVLKKGKTLGIMGPTGSGKSTLVHLLPRIYDISTGSITINGTDISSISKKQLRKNIGIVLQESFLFNKTIMENLIVANPNASKEDVYDACKVANVYDDIMNFKNGFDTMVGEGGFSLSGGQRQRISIARTILEKTDIIVFDDSLSAVDSNTDLQIRNELKGFKDNSTKIIISHRVSTIMDADEIIVLDDGAIIQQGTHEQLLAQDGMYAKVYSVQNKIDEDR